MKATQIVHPTSSLSVSRNKTTQRESKLNGPGVATVDQQRNDSHRQPALSFRTKVDAGKASIKRAFKGKENVPRVDTQVPRPHISSPRKLMSRAEARKRFHGNASKPDGNMADKDGVSVHL